MGVEYGIPQSSKRIDLLLSGRDETGRGNLMIVELKQWESARRTDMDGLVRTRFAEGEAEDKAGDGGGDGEKVLSKYTLKHPPYMQRGNP